MNIVKAMRHEPPHDDDAAVQERDQRGMRQRPISSTFGVILMVCGFAVVLLCLTESIVDQRMVLVMSSARSTAETSLTALVVGFAALISGIFLVISADRDR